MPPGAGAIRQQLMTAQPAGQPAVDGAEVIRGTTSPHPVPGSPIAQVKAPKLCDAPFASVGFDAGVAPIELAPEDRPVVLKRELTNVFAGCRENGRRVVLWRAMPNEQMPLYPDSFRLAGEPARHATQVRQQSQNGGRP